MINSLLYELEHKNNGIHVTHKDFQVNPPSIVHWKQWNRHCYNAKTNEAVCHERSIKSFNQREMLWQKEN